MIAKILALGALPAAFAAVAPRGDWASEPLTTATVYATSTYTVTSCAPEKTDCPYHGHGPVVVTEVVPLYTTVCAATEVDTLPKPTGSWPKPSGHWDHDHDHDEDDEDDEAKWACSTTTKYEESVKTVTSTLPPVVVTTKIPVTTITKTELSTEYSTCVHTVTNATKPYAATTLIPLTTVTKEVVSTSFSDCVHTVTNATSVYPVTTWVPATTVTACPVKPTGGSWPVESKPAGSWAPAPSKEWPAPPAGVSATWPAGAAKPTASWTKTASPAVVTAGAAAFGAAGAIKMLGAAAAAAVLVL